MRALRGPQQPRREPMVEVVSVTKASLASSTTSDGGGRNSTSASRLSRGDGSRVARGREGQGEGRVT